MLKIYYYGCDNRGQGLQTFLNVTLRLDYSIVTNRKECAMSRKKKYKTAEQELRTKKVYEIQDFEVPIAEKNKTYTRVTHYMKFHPNYLKMSPNAMVVLDYMKEWAFNPKNTEYIKYGTFDFAPSLVSRELKIMSDKTARNALKELQHYGFIEKANNAGFQYGLTQKWRFSSEWQDGERPLYTKEHIKGSSRDG